MPSLCRPVALSTPPKVKTMELLGGDTAAKSYMQVSMQVAVNLQQAGWAYDGSGSYICDVRSRQEGAGSW